MRFIHSLLVFVILILLITPSVQKRIPLTKEKELSGFFKLAPKPAWLPETYGNWFTGTYQQELTRNLEDHIGFRLTLFRLHNEYDYRFFGIAHAEGFIRGKKGYLFEEDYILEYTGKFFIGEAPIDHKLAKLQKVSRKLAESGTAFALVFEPGKASFFPEYIPGHYLDNGKTLSNYDYMADRVSELGIPLVDLNDWFIRMKDTSSHPLFPRYGMHWSIYGAALAMDTIRRYVESACMTPLPGMRVTGIVQSDSMRWTDRDIGDMLNLVFPLVPEMLAYPEVAFDTAQPRKLSVLVIADSYFINLINDLSGNLFREQTYWYYNSKLYPHILEGRDVVYVDKSDLRGKLLQFDIILLMVSEINLHCGFWNFADEAFQAFYPDHVDPPWYPYENTIRNNREWFRYMVGKADKNFTTLENAINRDARYLYQKENH